jgi:carbonic anhydrase
MDDVSFLRHSPLIRKEMTLKGYIYHIDSGLLEEIV